MKQLVALLLVVTLSGCSTLGVIGSFLGSDSGTEVNTNAQVGKENTQQLVGKQENIGDNAQITEADTSNKVQGTQIINEQVPFWLIVILVLLAGWAIPSPQEMARGIINFTRMLLGKEPLK